MLHDHMVGQSVCLYQEDGKIRSATYDDVLLHLPTGELERKARSGQYEWFEVQNCCCCSNWMFEFCSL